MRSNSLRRAPGRARLGFVLVLVGVACATQFADCLPELSERPDAPNLYWALAGLPRPFVDVDEAVRWERSVTFLEFPALRDVEHASSSDIADVLTRG